MVTRGTVTSSAQSQHPQEDYIETMTGSSTAESRVPVSVS